MDLVAVAEIVFGVTAAVTAASLAAATFDVVGRRPLVILGVAIGLAAVAAWVAFALRRDTALAVVAGGMTIAFAAEVIAVRMRDLLRAASRVDEQLARAQSRLHSLVAREAEERAAELERVLARARADSVSLLVEQERRIAEERRAAAVERTRAAVDELGEALTRAQQQVEGRFTAWTDDLERAQHGVVAQLAQLAQRQKQLISEAEARIAADAERLGAEGEQHRAVLIRLREDLARATQETVAAGTSELEGFAADRRRELHELNERLRRRERQLFEQIEREETEAMRRIQAAFADVERKQVEQLDRILQRTIASYSDTAAQQFSDTVRSAREGAATRLSRELDRSVQAFVREAQTVLGERLSQIGDAGAQRLEARLTQAAEALDRQRADAMTEFESRLTQAEHDLRRRLDRLASDTEAERAVLEARLQELARKIDDALART